MRYLYICLLILPSLVFSQTYSFEKQAEWVESIDIPANITVDKYNISEGYYLTLGDYQINLEQNAYYYHEVKNVVSYSGITNASQISITFDSAYQKVEIHHLYIWRGKEKIDRTKDLSFETLNNEYNLQQGLYMGKITIYDILNDIRKDDMIDFSYSIIGDNPIFANEKYLFLPLEFSDQVDLYSVRIFYPNKYKYTHKCVECDSSTYSSMLVGDNRVITIKLKDVKAKTYENNIPTWVCPYRHFLLSSVNSWNDVNAWAENVFALEEDPQLEDVFNEIFTGSETKNEKINKIINFVQDDIRYMGIESGLGSIKPFPPEQVVKQRFGDCKDKSLLLVSLLKKIGIENAYPALVNTYYKQSVDHYLPNNELFNHCIVNFEDNGSSYWVDPSIALQGGDYKDLFITNYGKALIVGKPTDTLQLIDQKEPKSLNKIIEDFNSESFTKPAQLKISSKKSGFEADNRRQFLEFYSINKLSDYVSDDLKTQFPTVNKTTEIEILDDFENNEFETIYNFDLDGFWQDGDKSSNKSAKGYWIFNYTPSSISYYISSSACNEREFDYEIIYPLNFEYQLTFHFPATLIIDDQNKRIDNEVFYYEETIEQINANSVKINYAFSTKKNHIAVDEYKDICEQINDIAKGLPLTFYFPK